MLTHDIIDNRNEKLVDHIKRLERAFRQEVASAIKRELNLFRRNSVAGQDLLKSLIMIYSHHNLQEWLDRRRLSNNDHFLSHRIF